tara:strand:- start:2145 stop:3098 length:954 start_codon:yes stop_codon:yes gene_type:complete
MPKPVNRVQTFKPETYDFEDVAGWRDHLEEQGFVVIHEAMCEEDTTETIELFKEEMRYVSPDWNWDEPKTWVAKNSPMTWDKGSVVFQGFGQSDSNWNIRLKSKAKEAFSEIYQTENVVTSFDGLSLFVTSSQKSPSWLHQDQRAEDNRLSVQGILNLVECGEWDAGFVCIPGTHKTYTPANAKGDWCMVPEGDPLHGQEVKVMTPPRSLILFHSKLVHANTGMAAYHPKGKHLNRLSAYVTFVPQERQPKNIFRKRLLGYLGHHELGGTTSHWADRWEPKKVPSRARGTYAKRNLRRLTPTLDEEGNIPLERLRLI